MKQSKKFNFNGIEYFYEVQYSDLETYSSTRTFVWRKMKIIPMFNFFFWKSKRTIEKPNILFTINFDIENEKLTKLQVREEIQKQLDLLKRKEEILRGELV